MSEIRFVRQSHQVLEVTRDPVGSIARAARTCYRSDGSDDVGLVRRLIRMGHEAMVEFAWMSVRFLTDRGTSHEMVRHRLFSFAQESQRYVNSDKRGFEYVLPEGIDAFEEYLMKMACRFVSVVYTALIQHGTKPEIARAVLVNATATTINVGGNMREWRHALGLRTEAHAHPQIRALMGPLLDELKAKLPALFEDIDGGGDGQE